MPTFYNIKRMKITFQENCDVWYNIYISEYNLETFSYFIDYPENKIEIDDFDSVYPIYKSKTADGKTLIEIKENPILINLKYIKKGFLKKEIVDENKTVLRYREDLQVDVDENQSQFWLQVHSPYSYISAIRKLSTAKYNNQFFAPGDLSSIILKQSGIMEIDWKLEIIDITKETNKDKKRQYSNDYINNKQHINDYTKKKQFYNIDGYCDNQRQYKWLDEIYEQIINKKSLKPSDIFYRYRVNDIINGSCFYLSAGSDITPIIALQDKIQTFVYCDEYGSYPNSDYCIEELWSKISEKLQQQNFKKIEDIKIDKKSLNIKDFHFSSGRTDKLEKVSMTLWEKNNKIYCLIYLNWDNSMAFHRLYVENRIIPKAICELLPDGGSIGMYSFIKIPYKFRMPEYAIGHTYSLGKPEEYELITDTIKYFGDYPTTYGNAGSINGINLYKRK